MAGARAENADSLPAGRVVRDPVFRDLLASDGIDPAQAWYPPIDALPGEYTLNDLVEWSQGSARRGLAEWLPEGKGTDRGAVEVELVNGFVEEFFPLVSDEGAEWSYSLGPAEKLLHDILDESTEYPFDGDLAAQVSWVEAALRERGVNV